MIHGQASSTRSYDPYPLIGPQEHAPKVKPVVLSIQVPVAAGRRVGRLDRESAGSTRRTTVGSGNDEGAVLGTELAGAEPGANPFTDALFVHGSTGKHHVHGILCSSRASASVIPTDSSVAILRTVRHMVESTRSQVRPFRRPRTRSCESYGSVPGASGVGLESASAIRGV